MEHYTNEILLLALAVGIYLVWTRRRAIQDANAKAWATAAEPFVVMSRHHMDDTVSSEAAYIREKLKEHGNQLLKDPVTGGYENAVFEEVYAAAETTTSRNFQVWLDLTMTDIERKRMAWREQKRQWNADAAKVQFGGQTINPNQSSN